MMTTFCKQERSQDQMDFTRAWSSMISSALPPSQRRACDENLDHSAIEHWSPSSKRRRFTPLLVFKAVGKDVVDATEAAVVGAQIGSSPLFVSQGQVTCAAPREKRLALTWLLMQSATLEAAWLQLKPSMHRWLEASSRPCWFGHLGQSLQDPLSRSQWSWQSQSTSPAKRTCWRASSNCSTVASSNLLAQVSNTGYASNASNEKGAFVTTEVVPRLSGF